MHPGAVEAPKGWKLGEGLAEVPDMGHAGLACGSGIGIEYGGVAMNEVGFPRGEKLCQMRVGGPRALQPIPQGGGGTETTSLHGCEAGEDLYGDPFFLEERNQRALAADHDPDVVFVLDQATGEPPE